MNAPDEDKKLAEELRLRPEPPPVTRLSRRVLIALAGVSSVALLGMTIWALQGRSGSGPAPELFNTEPKPTADGLAALPRDESAVPKNVP